MPSKSPSPSPSTPPFTDDVIGLFSQLLTQVSVSPGDPEWVEKVALLTKARDQIAAVADNGATMSGIAPPKEN